MGCCESENKCWYYYIGSDGQEQVLSNYVMTDDFIPCTPPGLHLCSICAPCCGPNPCFISDNLIWYIALVKSFGTPQPALPVGAKKYAYPRSL